MSENRDIANEPTGSRRKALSCALTLSRDQNDLREWLSPRQDKGPQLGEKSLVCSETALRPRERLKGRDVL